MGRQKRPFKSSNQPEQSPTHPIVERLHSSFRETFIPLPEQGQMLTDEQLDALFGGNPTALRDLVRLARQPVQD